MDPSEFADSFFELCKAIALCTVRLNKAKLRSGISGAKLGLSVAEVDLLAEKICTCFEWAKRKLRDSGSGSRLPPSVRGLRRTWKKHCKTQQKEKETKDNPKKMEEKHDEAETMEEKHDEAETMEEAESEKKDIRDVFGLGPKEVNVVDEIALVCSSSDAED